MREAGAGSHLCHDVDPRAADGDDRPFFRKRRAIPHGDERRHRRMRLWRRDRDRRVYAAAQQRMEKAGGIS